MYSFITTQTYYGMDVTYVCVCVPVLHGGSDGLCAYSSTARCFELDCYMTYECLPALLCVFSCDLHNSCVAVLSQKRQLFDEKLSID